MIIIQFMAQKLIYLEGVDPIDFYGVNNVRFNKLKSYFADLKIVSRGNEIRVEGDSSRIDLFEEKIEILRKYLLKFNRISDSENTLSRKM